MDALDKQTIIDERRYIAELKSALGSHTVQDICRHPVVVKISDREDKYSCKCCGSELSEDEVVQRNFD